MKWIIFYLEFSYAKISQELKKKKKTIVQYANFIVNIDFRESLCNLPYAKKYISLIAKFGKKILKHGAK